MNHSSLKCPKYVRWTNIHPVKNRLKSHQIRQKSIWPETSVIQQGVSHDTELVLAQNVKVDAFPKCDFIPVDFYEVRHVKASFKKLMRACCPSRPPSSSEHGYLKAVEESEWLPQVRPSFYLPFFSFHSFSLILPFLFHPEVTLCGWGNFKINNASLWPSIQPILSSAL